MKASGAFEGAAPPSSYVVLLHPIRPLAEQLSSVRVHTGPSLARTMADTESAVAELPPAGVRPRHTTLSPHNAGETRVRSSGSNGGSGSTLGLTSFTHQQTRDVQTRREVVSFTTRTPQLSPAHVAPHRSPPLLLLTTPSGGGHTTTRVLPTHSGAPTTSHRDEPRQMSPADCVD